jgi:hypothetical protein
MTCLARSAARSRNRQAAPRRRSALARASPTPDAPRAAAPRTSPPRSTRTTIPATPTRSPSGRTQRRRPAPTAAPRTPPRPAAPGTNGTPPAPERPSSRPGPGPVAGLFPVTGLTAALAVLGALPLGLLPRPPGLLRPDPLLRRRSPRVAAIHVQAALHLREPQPQPPDQLMVGIQLRPRFPGLRVPLPQPCSRAFAARSPAASSGTGSSGTRRRIPHPPAPRK